MFKPYFFLLICLWLVKTSVFSISTFGCYLHFQNVERSQFLLKQILGLPWFYFLTYYYYSTYSDRKKSKQIVRKTTHSISIKIAENIN